MKRRLETMTRLVAGLARTLTCFTAGATLLAQTLRITSPVDGTVVHPGQVVTVTASVSGGTFPYVILGAENPIGYSETLFAPPYQFSVPVPPRISLRRYSLMAGCTASSKEGAYARVSIDVERPDAPVKVEVQPSLLNLVVDGTGLLFAYATYADDATEDVSQSTLTKWSSDSPDVVTVTDDGRVIAVGPGAAKITMENAGQIAVVPVTVKTSRPAANGKP
jgi:hypothetical protein